MPALFGLSGATPIFPNQVTSRLQPRRCAGQLLSLARVGFLQSAISQKETSLLSIFLSPQV